MKAPFDTVNSLISVGILTAPAVRFSLSGDFSLTVDGVPAVLPAAEIYEAAADADGRVCLGSLCGSRLELHPGSPQSRFTLLDVEIGIGFHWQQTEPQTFEGRLLLSAAPGGGVRVIDEVGIERYLLSVISSEMNAAAPLELLKAHAVISRSWLVAQLHAYRDSLPPAPAAERMVDSPARVVKWCDRDDHDGFDVCADDHCQRYQGVTRAASDTVALAVAATAGIVLLSPDGEVCDARFSKCCGGRSELFSTCWDSQNRANSYLTSVPCDWCGKATGRPELLKTLLNSYDTSTTPDFHDWTVCYTADSLRRLVEERSGRRLGRIKALTPLRRGPSGRIISLSIEGEFATVEVGKELFIRRWLSSSHLYSSAFDVTARGADPDGFPLEFVLEGHGWGHGVGLCQIGAAVMAAEGMDFAAILSHYFPLCQLSSPA